MSKNTRNRILLTAVAALLLVVMTVGGTLAWLTDSTGEVVNTFTPTDVDIELNETLPAGKTAEMVPSVDISKNPSVTVKSGSEASYVYVVVEEIGVINDWTFDDYLEYSYATGWELVASTSKTEDKNDVYVLGRAVAETTADTSFDILANNKVTTKSGVTKAMMDAVTDANHPQLSFQAYAIQQANGTGTFTIETAWTQLGVTLPVAVNPAAPTT